jgi:hypothetical protein
VCGRVLADGVVQRLLWMKHMEDTLIALTSRLLQDQASGSASLKR